MKKMISITVTGPDRPGIIAALTGAIFKAGGNLEDASMTILEGEFAMILIACLKNTAMERRLFRDLARLERLKKLTVMVKEIKRRLVRGEQHRRGTEPHVISVYGKDRAGIVYQVSKLLADHGLNITDLNSRIVGSGAKSLYALILEADIPSQPTFLASLKKRFDQLAKKMGVSVTLKHLESVQF